MRLETAAWTWSSRLIEPRSVSGGSWVPAPEAVAVGFKGGVGDVLEVVFGVELLGVDDGVEGGGFGLEVGDVQFGDGGGAGLGKRMDGDMGAGGTVAYFSVA